jgi:SPP1 gp7 family putative phage head morphogenesis protein
MSVNEDILDLAITHAHYAERFKTYEVEKILGILKKADGELRDRILKYDFESWTKKYLKEVQNDLLEVQRAYSGQLVKELDKDLSAFGAQEARLQKSRIDKVAGKYLEKAGVSYTVPTPEQLRVAVNTTPLLMDNQAWNLKTLIESIGLNSSTAIKQSLKYSYATGESIQDAKRRLLGTATREGVTRKVKRQAEMVVRTAMTHMSNVTRKVTYEQNEDIVNGYEWISTLDQRTTDICQWRDGRVWMYDEGMRVRTEANLLPGPVYPPAHPNCRSTTVPVLKSWKDLGIDYKDVNAEERASMNGQVAGKVTYTDWIKKQPFHVQKEVLGKAKALALKSGAVNVNQFYNKDGRMLTIEQLRDKGLKVGTPPKSSMPPTDDLYKDAVDAESPKISNEFVFEKNDSFRSSLNDFEREGLEAYKGVQYLSMNKVLRGIEKEEYDTPIIRQHIRGMKDAFRKAPKLDVPLKVYRGGDFNDTFFKKLKSGATIVDNGFVSTTTKYDISKGFASDGGLNKVVFDLKAPKGKAFIPGNYIKQELIFDSGSKIKIIGIRYDNDFGGTIVEGLIL